MATLAPTTTSNPLKESLVPHILPVMRTKSDGDLGMERLMSHSLNREGVSTPHTELSIIQGQWKVENEREVPVQADDLETPKFTSYHTWPKEVQ